MAKACPVLLCVTPGQDHIWGFWNVTLTYTFMARSRHRNAQRQYTDAHHTPEIPESPGTKGRLGVPCWLGEVAGEKLPFSSPGEPCPGFLQANTVNEPSERRECARVGEAERRGAERRGGKTTARVEC